MEFLFVFHVLILHLKMEKPKEKSVLLITYLHIVSSCFATSLILAHALQMATYLLKILPSKTLAYQFPLKIL